MTDFLSIVQMLWAKPEVQMLVKLVLIVFLSGFIGFERESLNKPAGFRTYVLVGISSVIVMVCGDYLYEKTNADPTRIPAQLLSGIGFLGAGTILRDGFNVKGLTTAAGLLAVTCVGLAVGAGFYLGAIIATIVVYIVLSYSHVLSSKLEHYNFLDLEVVAGNTKLMMDEVKKICNKEGLELVQMKINKEKSSDCVRIVAKCKAKTNLNEIIAKIMQIDTVTEVTELKEI